MALLVEPTTTESDPHPTRRTPFMTDDQTSPTPSSLDRRTLLRSAGVVSAGAVGVGVLAACGSGDDTAAGSGGDSSSSSSGSSSGGSATSSGGSSTSGAGGGAGGISVASADVPVGGGTILADSAVVVTQPTAGTFKAFSSICTHQGCPVTKVQDGKIECPCHGSMFDISTGEPTAGPARKALAAKTATVDGSNVVVS